MASPNLVTDGVHVPHLVPDSGDLGEKGGAVLCLSTLHAQGCRGEMAFSQVIYLCQLQGSSR